MTRLLLWWHRHEARRWHRAAEEYMDQACEARDTARYHEARIARLTRQRMEVVR